MKVGIVTLGGYYNYGNRLQNFALYWVLTKKLGVSAATVVTPSVPIVRPIKNLRNFARFIIKDVNRYSPMKKRIEYFRKFTLKHTQEYLPEQISILSDKDSKSFDKFIVGSDQVWNFDFMVEHEEGIYMLMGVNERKRVSYAASMGNPPVKAEYLEMFSKEIKKFDHVSVREAGTVTYLKENFEVDAELVLDPVFLLTSEEWRTVLDISEPKTQYIFTYFLSKPRAQFAKFIEDYAKKMNCNIVAFQSLSMKNRKYFSNSPEKFVERISGAQAVFTDSFHASAFSTIFETPYLVDNNRRGGSMSSRIKTLIELTGVKNTVLTDNTSDEFANNIDFSKCRDNINKLRKQSLSFLKNAVFDNEK